MPNFKIIALGKVTEATSAKGNPYKTVDVQLEGHTEAGGWANVYLGDKPVPVAGDQIEGELKNDPKYGWKLEMPRGGATGTKKPWKPSGDIGAVNAGNALIAAATASKKELSNEDLIVRAKELLVFIRQQSDNAVTEKQRGFLFKLFETKQLDDPDLEKHVRDDMRVGKFTKSDAGELIDTLNALPDKSGNETKTYPKPEYGEPDAS